MVCTLHEGDDFGKLALVTDSPRAASIVLREDNCHFLRVDKEDFNRILRVGGLINVALITHQTHSLHHPSESTVSSVALLCPLMLYGLMFVSLLWRKSCITFFWAATLNLSPSPSSLLFFSKDVEANTVRLKEHEQAVLVLEKSPRPSTLGSIK